MLTTAHTNRPIPCWACLTPAHASIEGHPYPARRTREPLVAVERTGVALPAVDPLRPAEKPPKPLSWPLAPWTPALCARRLSLALSPLNVAL